MSTDTNAPLMKLREAVMDAQMGRLMFSAVESTLATFETLDALLSVGHDLPKSWQKAAPSTQHVEALKLIARTGCQHYTNGNRCCEPGTGRFRRATFMGERWCAPCIAFKALGDEAAEPNPSDEARLMTRVERLETAVIAKEEALTKQRLEMESLQEKLKASESRADTALKTQDLLLQQRDRAQEAAEKLSIFRSDVQRSLDAYSRRA